MVPLPVLHAVTVHNHCFMLRAKGVLPNLDTALLQYLEGQNGGAGIGDPRERGAELVQGDVESGLVSADNAAKLYGQAR